MRLSSFDNKTRIYLAIVVLLFVYAEWVNCIATGVSAIISFTQGVF